MGDINKVVFGDRTLIDLTSDTVTEDTLLSGYTAHRRDGHIIVGTVDVPHNLNDLSDVNISNPENGQILGYDSQSNQWINTVLSADILRVRFGTQQEWDSNPQYKSEANTLYVYTDHDTVNGQDIPAIKIGDGTSYLIDMRYITDNASVLFNHINDLGIHVTPQEKEFWNNKERCYQDSVNPRMLVFTKN